MSQKERQLLVAVDKGHTKLIETLIAQGTSVNCRVKDDGSTPLIKAARNRNHIVQKLLLQRGADISAKNALGLTALHYTTEAGDDETLKLLLAYQAPLNAPDVEGCTPLHYAANRNNISTAEILIFCGANADYRNKRGTSPFKINKTEAFRKLAIESRAVLEGIVNRDIVIEHDELFPGKVSHFKSLGLTVFTPENFKLTSLSFLCRRVRPEFCADSLKPEGKEILISDAFEYITSTVHVKGIVELEVPLYDHHDPYEKIQIKTNLGVIKDPAAIVECPTTMSEHSGVLRWKLRIRLDITKTKSFILITIPKLEKFPITSRGGEFVSEVDRFINIKVAPHTFQSGTVNLEVIPTPVYKSENYKNILSIGHFYDLHHSLMVNQFQKNGVTFTSPLPHEFENEGELCFLAADVPRDFDPDYHEPLDINIWEILDRDPKTKKGRVACDLSHFSTHVLAEKRKGISDTDFKKHVNEIHTKAIQKAKVVRFFAVLKPRPGNLYEAILECTIPQKIKDRLNHWRSEDYIVLSPECTGEFDTQEKQEYDINLSGNVKRLGGTTKLQFHSKRENFQTLVICLANKEEPAFGSLDIVEISQEKEVTSISLWLSGMPVKDTPRKKDTFLGFTREELLKKIASNLGPKWSQFCVLLGIPFHKVEKIRTKSDDSAAVEKNVVKALLDWRKHSQHLDDMGVVDLVTALSRVGRNDIADLVHEDLRDWLKKNEIEKGDRFYKWAENALNGTVEITRKQDYLEPMSDEFFVLLVEKFATPDFQNLGVLMGIPENQNSNIFADTTFPNHQYKVLRMLIVARERHLDRMESLTNLIDALETTEKEQCLEWIDNCIKKWVKRNQEKKNRTKFHLDLERLVRKEAGEEKEEEEEEEGEERELGVGYELEQDEESVDKQSLNQETGDSQHVDSENKSAREADQQSINSNDNENRFSNKGESEKQTVPSDNISSEGKDVLKSENQSENFDLIESKPKEVHEPEKQSVNTDDGGFKFKEVHETEKDVISGDTSSEHRDVSGTEKQGSKPYVNDTDLKRIHKSENLRVKSNDSVSKLNEDRESETEGIKLGDTASEHQEIHVPKNKGVKSDNKETDFTDSVKEQSVKTDSRESEFKEEVEKQSVNSDSRESKFKENVEKQSFKTDIRESEFKEEVEKQSIKTDSRESEFKEEAEKQSVKSDSREFEFKEEVEKQSLKTDSRESEFKEDTEKQSLKTDSRESKFKEEVEKQSVKSDSREFEFKEDTEKQSLKTDSRESEFKEEVEKQSVKSDSRKFEFKENVEKQSVKSESKESEFKEEVEKQSVKSDSRYSQFKESIEKQSIKSDGKESEFKENVENQSVKSDNRESEFKKEAEKRSIKSDKNDSLQEDRESKSEAVKSDSSDSKQIDLMESQKQSGERDERDSKHKEVVDFEKLSVKSDNNDSELDVRESVKEDINSDENRGVKSYQNGVKSDEKGLKSDNIDSEHDVHESSDHRAQSDFNNRTPKDTNETMEQSIQSNDQVSKINEDLEPTNENKSLQSYESKLRGAGDPKEDSEDSRDNAAGAKEVSESEIHSDKSEQIKELEKQNVNSEDISSKSVHDSKGENGTKSVDSEFEKIGGHEKPNDNYESS